MSRVTLCISFYAYIPNKAFNKVHGNCMNVIVFGYGLTCILKKKATHSYHSSGFYDCDIDNPLFCHEYVFFSLHTTKIVNSSDF